MKLKAMLLIGTLLATSLVTFAPAVAAEECDEYANPVDGAVCLAEETASYALKHAGDTIQDLGPAISGAQESCNRIVGKLTSDQVVISDRIPLEQILSEIIVSGPGDRPCGYSGRPTSASATEPVLLP